MGKTERFFRIFGFGKAGCATVVDFSELSV
jgi:hypothetical protein